VTSGLADPFADAPTQEVTQETEITQSDLNAAYGEYLRVRYLRMNMEKVAEERSNKVRIDVVLQLSSVKLNGFGESAW